MVSKGSRPSSQWKNQQGHVNAAQINTDEKEEGNTEENYAIKRHSNAEALSKQRNLDYRNDGESAPSILKAVRQDGGTHRDAKMKAHKKKLRITERKKKYEQAAGSLEE